MSKCDHPVLVFEDLVGTGDWHHLYKCQTCDYIVWVDTPSNNFLSDEYATTK